MNRKKNCRIHLPETHTHTNSHWEYTQFRFDYIYLFWLSPISSRMRLAMGNELMQQQATVSNSKCNVNIILRFWRMLVIYKTRSRKLCVCEREQASWAQQHILYSPPVNLCFPFGFSCTQTIYKTTTTKNCSNRKGESKIAICLHVCRMLRQHGIKH